MNKEIITNKIEQIAIRLVKEKEVYTRSDLAFDLKKYGISEDSKLVEKLVFDAYEKATNVKTKNAIKKSFFKNDFSRNLIDNKSIEFILEDKNLNFALNKFKANSASISNSINSYTNELTDLLANISHFIVKKEILEHLTGSIQVKKVKEEANHIFNSYIKICGGYTETRLKVSNLIDDFVSLRSELLRKYYETASMLIDVYGTNIKSISPELFDFESISWLDVESMQKNIELEFDKILIECGELIKEINQEFLSNLSDSSNLLGKEGNNKKALILGFYTLIESWTNSAEKAAKLKQSLEVLKSRVNKDSYTIKQDLMRLTVIQKTVNDIFIPKALIFQRQLDKVITNDLDIILRKLEDHPEIKELNENKKELLDKEQLLEKIIIDHKKEIESLKFNVSSTKSVLKKLRPIYDEIKLSKPNKPFIKIGPFNKKYNRKISNWYH